MRLRLLAISALALALTAPALASTPRPDARAWLVQNGATGEVLLSEHTRDRVPVASITKLMTVLVALEHARPDDVVTIEPQAASVGESTISLVPGEQVRVGDLVEAALIQSANDAAWALALHVGDGSADRFVALMNAKAAALGLTDTHFVRPDGLDAPGHVSSARDVTRLARVAMRNPLVRDVVARRTEVAAGRTLSTWNDLLSTYPGLIGVKTGHTDGAGWSQVAAARGRGTTIYATILGSPTREERNADLAELLSWGFSRYRLVRLVEPGHVYASAAAPYDRAPIELIPAGGLTQTVRADRPLVEKVIAPASVSLPVQQGERLGEVQFWSGARLVGARALVAAESVERPGLLGRIGWYAGRAVENAWGLVS